MGNFVLLQEFFRHIGKDALYAGLGIVKVAGDGAHADVFALHGGHLGALDGADALIREENDDADARHIAEAGERRGAGIAAGGGEDEDFLLPAQLFHGAAHQLGQHGERHILECGGGAVEELQHVFAVYILHGGDFRCFKFICIGALYAQRDFFLRIARQVIGKNPLGHGAEIRVHQLLNRDRGNLLRHIKAAVRRDAPEHCLRRGNARLISPRAVKQFHIHSSLLK